MSPRCYTWLWTHSNESCRTFTCISNMATKQHNPFSPLWSVKLAEIIMTLTARWNTAVAVLRAPQRSWTAGGHSGDSAVFGFFVFLTVSDRREPHSQMLSVSLVLEGPRGATSLKRAAWADGKSFHTCWHQRGPDWRTELRRSASLAQSPPALWGQNQRRR